MSPEDIIHNYFFHEPAEKEKKISDSLHLSSRSPLYAEKVERNNFQIDESFQKNEFREPIYIWHNKVY